MHSQADTTTEEWGLLCSVWYEKYGGRVVTARDVYGVARENDLLLDLWAGRAMLGGQQRFGHALAGKRDRVFGPFRITRAGKDRRTRSQGWMLALTREAANRPGKNPRKPPQTPAAPGEPGVGEDSGVSGVISESDPWDEEKKMTSRTCVVVPSIDKMVERLRKGQKWMTVRWLDAADRPESPLNIPILASLDQWDQLDSQLRELGFKSNKSW